MSKLNTVVSFAPHSLPVIKIRDFRRFFCNRYAFIAFIAVIKSVCYINF